MHGQREVCHAGIAIRGMRDADVVYSLRWLGKWAKYGILVPFTTSMLVLVDLRVQTRVCV